MKRRGFIATTFGAALASIAGPRLPADPAAAEAVQVFYSTLFPGPVFTAIDGLPVRFVRQGDKFRQVFAHLDRDGVVDVNPEYHDAEFCLHAEPDGAGGVATEIVSRGDIEDGRDLHARIMERIRKEC